MEFKLKGNMKDEDFLIHILNNLLEENNGVLDGLENYLILFCSVVLIIK